MIFVVKLLQRFPRINPDWLLLDSDKMYRADNEGRQPAQATLPNVTAHTGSLFETQDINAAGSDSDGMIMSDRRMPDAEDGSRRTNTSDRYEKLSFYTTTTHSNRLPNSMLYSDSTRIHNQPAEFVATVTITE